MASLIPGLHPMMYYLYLACILINIVPNNGIVEAAVQLLQDRGLAGVSVHAGELSFVACGLSSIRAMRRTVWAKIFEVFLGIYLLFFNGIYED